MTSEQAAGPEARTARTWSTEAILRTSAKRVAAADAKLGQAIEDAYAEGMSTRAIGRAVGRSHRWIIDVLRERGVYGIEAAGS